MRKRKEEPPFDIEAYDLSLYHLCLSAGDWYNASFFFGRVAHLVKSEVFRVLILGGRRKSPMETNDVELSEETKALLAERSKAGCVSCGYILDDWKKNNRLTDYGNFPAEAKINHVEAEKKGEI